MKNKRIIDILLGLTFLGLIGSAIFNRYSTAKKNAPVAPPSITRANDILRRKTIIPDKFLNTTATSSACTLFLKKSAELTMNDYANEFIDHHVDGIVKTCAGAFPTLLQQRIDKAIFQCKSSVRDNITKECYAALIEAKTSSVAVIIKSDADPKDLDASILLHLIANKFMTGDMLEHPEEALAIIDALLDKEPGYLSGYKVKILLLTMSSLNSDEYYQDILQDTLDEAKRLSPNDPEIKEMVLVAKGNIFKQDKSVENTEFITYLDSEISKHPNVWIYDYFKANAIYRGGLGDYEKTLAIIEGALKKAPGDARLKQTLENLKSDDEAKRKHPFNISIGFSLDDL